MSIEAMKLALEALEKNYVLINGTERFLGLDQIKDTYYAGCFDVDGINKQTNDAITTLRTAIEQAEKQEPVAYVTGYYGGRCVIEPLNKAMVMPSGMALYTTPPAAQEPVAWQQELGNILCLIHRDGGDYISEHGWRKAIDDADLKVAKLNAESDTSSEQKPVAYKWKGELFTPGEIEMLDVDDAVPLYQNPQPVECMCGICKLGKWEWVGLANEEIEAVMHGSVEGERMLPYQFARAIEAELKAKNEAP